MGTVDLSPFPAEQRHLLRERDTGNLFVFAADTAHTPLLSATLAYLKWGSGPQPVHRPG